MAGDPTQVGAWLEADVYIGSTTASNPSSINGVWPGTWDLVGLLDGADGFTHSRSEDKTDLFAWGGIIVRTRRKNFKQTVKFSALEDNDTTRALVWPGSALNGPFVVPTVERVRIGLELREGLVCKRLISTYQAEVELDGDFNENEDSLAKFPMIATIFPDGDGKLWTIQEGTQSS